MAHSTSIASPALRRTVGSRWNRRTGWGLAGTHHCKAIDLIPDFIGAVVGLLIVVLRRMIANARLAGRNGESGPVEGTQTDN